MRVPIVASEAASVVSGVARAVDEIATGLTARGHHVRIVDEYVGISIVEIGTEGRS